MYYKNGVRASPGIFFQISRGFFFRIRGLYSKTHKARSSNHAERVRAPTFFQHGKVAILWSRLCCELQYHHNWRTITYFHLSSTLWGAFYFLILHAICSEKSWNILQPLLCRSFHDCLLSMSLKWKTTIISSLGRNQDKWTTDGKQVKAAVPVYTAIPGIPLMAAGGRCHLLSSILVPNWDGEAPWESPLYEAPYFLFFLEQ